MEGSSRARFFLRPALRFLSREFKARSSRQQIGATVPWLGAFFIRRSISAAGSGRLSRLHNRLADWKYVFYTNAAFICVNFLLLLTYREPGKEERLARQQRVREGTERQRSLVMDSLAELKKPHLFWYLAIFSVWWVMFPMLWDVLPKYVDDWVNTAPLVHFLFGSDGTQNPVWKFLLGMGEHGQTIQPEGIVNINAGMIMLTCFAFAALSAKMRATTSMLTGTVLIIGALSIFGATHSVGLAVLAMILFSVGEMLASPKFSEFLGNIAPPDKKAMWIGFSQAPILIGWTIEGKLGRNSTIFSRPKTSLPDKCSMRRGLSADQVTKNALPVGEAFKRLVEFTGESSEKLTHQLYQAHHIGMTWFVFAAIGVASAVMIYIYGRWTLKLAARGTRRECRTVAERGGGQGSLRPSILVFAWRGAPVPGRSNVEIRPGVGTFHRFQSCGSCCGRGRPRSVKRPPVREPGGRGEASARPRSRQRRTIPPRRGRANVDTARRRSWRTAGRRYAARVPALCVTPRIPPCSSRGVKMEINPIVGARLRPEAIETSARPMSSTDRVDA